MACCKYALAIMRWVRKGQPTRSDTEVDRIASTCKGCENYNAQRCVVCKCRVRSVAEEVHGGVHVALTNKIRMATEDCPVKCKQCGKSKWGCECYLASK